MPETILLYKHQSICGCAHLLCKAAGNSISSHLGSSWQGNRYSTKRAGSTARPSRTKIKPAGSLSSRQQDRPSFWASPLAFGFTVETYLRLLRPNSWTLLGKKSQEFSLLLTVTSAKEFFSPPPLEQKWDETGIWKFKSKNSQDYAQKPQQNYTFMNLASVFL